MIFCVCVCACTCVRVHVRACARACVCGGGKMGKRVQGVLRSHSVLCVYLKNRERESLSSALFPRECILPNVFQEERVFNVLMYCFLTFGFFPGAFIFKGIRDKTQQNTFWAHLDIYQDWHWHA